MKRLCSTFYTPVNFDTFNFYFSICSASSFNLIQIHKMPALMKTVVRYHPVKKPGGGLSSEWWIGDENKKAIDRLDIKLQNGWRRAGK